MENSSETPPRKKRKIQATSSVSQDMEAEAPHSMDRSGHTKQADVATESTSAVTPVVDSTPGSSSSEVADAGASPVEAGSSVSKTDVVAVPPSEVPAEMPEAKADSVVQGFAAVAAPSPPVAKAPVPKVRARHEGQSSGTQSVLHKSIRCRCCTALSPRCTDGSSHSARIPQDTAADTIVARAKADAQRAAAKKKKRKVQKKFSTAINSSSAAAEASAEAAAQIAVSETAVDGEVAEDPYAVAMVDPYAS